VTEASQDVAQDAAQDVAEDVLGAAEDGSMKVFILLIVIFQGRNPRPTHASPHACPYLGVLQPRRHSKPAPPSANVHTNVVLAHLVVVVVKVAVILPPDAGKG